MASEYDRIPAPAKRCENCAHGTMHVTSYGDRWPDVYRCSLDGDLKDYRVTCDQHSARKPEAA